MTIAVPLNTMLADLDETLRRLLGEELGAHGFGGVRISFDAPRKDWAAAVSTPAVNLFLYDLREAVKRRPAEWGSSRENGRTQDLRPPMRVEVSYAVTAWARSVEDEHRLLSQVLGILFAHQVLPDEALVGTLANGSQPFSLETTIAQPRSEARADFWSAVGGEYKASLDYVVLVSCPSGMAMLRGPDVQTETVRFEPPEGSRAEAEERHAVAGTARWEDGGAAVGTWILLSEIGAVATADERGRFVLRGVPAGRHRLQARSPGGTETEGVLEVPGARADVVLALPPDRAETSA